jgi:hypothetical protein
MQSWLSEPRDGGGSVPYSDDQPIVVVPAQVMLYVTYCAREVET